MLYKHSTYPTPPLPPLAAILLEAFEANERCRESDQEGGVELPDLEYQRACALAQGGRERARDAGGKDNHAEQAATLLVVIDDLDQLLAGHWSRNGKLVLDDDEREVLRVVRNATASLLRWHFDNGAGALLPIAVDLDLVK